MIKRQTSISVIMPIYNESRLLIPAVQMIDNFMSKHFATYEILIIESGSTDGSGDQCDQLACEYATVRVIHEGGKNGFGSALQLGYRHATYDYCWLVTADIPFPLETILEAEEKLAQYDFIISYRSEDKRAWTRRVQSFFYNVLVRFVFHLPVRCVNSAFKLLPTVYMSQMPLISKFWFIDAEIIYRLTYAGLSCIELPVPLIDRTEGSSSVAPNAFVKMLSEMWDFVKIRRSIPDKRQKAQNQQEKRMG